MTHSNKLKFVVSKQDILILLGSYSFGGILGMALSGKFNRLDLIITIPIFLILLIKVRKERNSSND